MVRLPFVRVVPEFMRRSFSTPRKNSFFFGETATVTAEQVPRKTFFLFILGQNANLFCFKRTTEVSEFYFFWRFFFVFFHFNLYCSLHSIFLYLTTCRKFGTKLRIYFPYLNPFNSYFFLAAKSMSQIYSQHTKKAFTQNINRRWILIRWRTTESSFTVIRPV